MISGSIDCRFGLSGNVSDIMRACEGRVVLNGQPLACNDPNGWRLIDKGHIEIMGSACDTFKSDPNSLIDASFPCDVILL